MAQHMNRNTRRIKPRVAPHNRSTALYEVIYVDTSSHPAPTLPKPADRIAYVRRIGLEGTYLIPRDGRWVEVTPEAAFQRAEGLRRLRTSDPAPAFEHSAS